MCGIVGSLPASEDAKITSALNRIAHRGPDGMGFWSNLEKEVSLGHRRLSILDLSENGKQPMHYEHLSITYNGEIFNFIELKQELTKSGFSFKTETDTEMILAAYIKWGPECVKKFNGMWAFGIWDNINKTLFLARDRFGIKPLYYIQDTNSFSFASEMTGLFPFIEKRQISKDFFWCKENVFVYEGTQKCLIDKIVRLPAGHFAIYNAKSHEFKITKFWSTINQLVEIPKKYEDQVQVFRELFIDACKIRMRSDVPIGTALSGGVDSSVIACAMNIARKRSKERIPDNWQKAFVASFSGTFLDETIYARKVVDHLGLDGHFFEMDKFADFSLVEKYIGQLGDLSSTSPVPMVELYKKVKDHGVTVTLDGHGADEALAGYVDSLYYMFLDRPFDATFHAEIHDSIQAMYQRNESNSRFRVYKDFSKFLIKRSGGHIIEAINKSMGLKKSLKVPYKLTIPNNSLGFFNSHLYELFHYTILPTLLRNYDRYSMIGGVESRMPFLDHRIVSFLFSLPYESKFKNGFTKSIVRDAFANDLPNDIIYRKGKIGFNTPVVDWMKTIWKENLLEIAHSKGLQECSLVDGNYVKKSLLHVINDSNITFSEGMNAWQALEPYLWQKNVLND